jgi:hypothetical protein
MSSNALSLSSSTTTIPSILFVSVSEKLMKTNYLLWCAHVLLAIRAAQLKDLLTANDVAPAKTIIITNIDKSSTTMTNPAYASWVAWDQAVLGYLLSS